MIYNIIQYPDSRLKQKASIVKDFKAVQDIIDNMFETHYAQNHCAALAATQLDMPNPPHITVIDFSEKQDQPLCLVNGKITQDSGLIRTKEGCMSVLGIYKAVKRAEKISVESFDRHGKVQNFEADGFLAKCIQHELDHLDGKIYLDHLSNLQRKLADQELQRIWSKA